MEVLQAHLTDQLRKLAKRLGHARETKIIAELQHAFSTEFRVGRHIGWVSMLLSEYYDPGYTYYLNRLERKSLYKGTLVQCREWIQEWIHSGRKLS